MMNQVSLLYQGAQKIHVNTIGMPDFLQDLQFQGILQVMCAGQENTDSRQLILSVLSELCQEPEHIRHRYDILQDFTNHHPWIDDLQMILEQTRIVERDRQSSARMRNRVTAEFKLAKEISIFLQYCDIDLKLSKWLKQHESGFRSAGLQTLTKTFCSETMQTSVNGLREEFRQMKQGLKGYMRLTLLTGLDTSFKLTEAQVLDFNSNGFATRDPNRIYKLSMSGPIKTRRRLFAKAEPDQSYRIKPIDFMLEQNVQEIKDKSLASLAAILEAMSSVHSAYLRSLSQDLIFYRAALNLVIAMESCGLPLCKPEIHPSDERYAHIQGGYDLGFAFFLRAQGYDRPMEKIVANDVRLTDSGRIQVITGPNQGGKTTYIRSIGILQVLAQAGLPVPATRATISPADRILTHFPSEENPGASESRLDEELDRMFQIMNQATPNSLILMNESFASTNAREGSRIAEDVLSALAIMGARCAFVTHLYEFAERIDAVNEKLDCDGQAGSRLISLTAQYIRESQDETSAPGPVNCESENETSVPDSAKHAADTGSEAPADSLMKTGPVCRRTYRIVPGAPAVSSFAADVARQFGIMR